MMHTYSNQGSWREFQRFLPASNRLDSNTCPTEEYWKWRGNLIHLDRYSNPCSKVKLIMLHGVGGNGRLLSFIGVPLHRRGYEVVCPDLPGYGMSNIVSKVDYGLWVDMVTDLIEHEASQDSRPIVLFGLSAGGMLAYHAGCTSDHVAAMIFTNLLDQRLQEVRDYSAVNKLMSRLGVYALTALERISPKLNLPMRFVSNMQAIVNDEQALTLLIRDTTASGASVSVEFLTSMIRYSPKIEPEHFQRCPLLLVHPEQDLWTDVRLSRLTFDKFSGHKTLRILQGAGHFPIEQPGLCQLEEYLVEFLTQDSLYERH